MFLIEKRNMQVVGWLRASMWVQFYVILRFETGPDNHNRRLIYVRMQSYGHRGGAILLLNSTTAQA
jgi:hypothetical protein